MELARRNSTGREKKFSNPLTNPGLILRNYRGVHLTTILSKVAEKAIGNAFLQHCQASGAFGANQWAYQKDRSSKDLLTYLICIWLLAAMMGKCIGTLLDDIPGAFDRVAKFFLLCCLRSAGVNSDY